MATLNAVEFARGGVQADNGAAAGAAGDDFVNTGNELVVIKNANAGAVAVTVETPGTVDGMAVPDKVVNVPAGQTFIIGPFPPQWYSSATNRVKVTCAPNASVTVKVLRPTGLRGV